MLRLKRFWVVFFCLVLVLLSGSSTNLSATSNELEKIALDFSIALETLKMGYQSWAKNSENREKALIGLGFELELALIDNENLRSSLKSQQLLVESLQKESGAAKQRSFDLENTLTATRQKADLDLRQAVVAQQAKLKLWRVLAIGGIALVAVETVMLIIK